MKADKRTMSEVKSTLERMTESYSRRDMDGLLKLLSPDQDVTWFGTGADEERRGIEEIRAQMQRDWAQSESALLKWRNLSVSNAGSIAWAAGDLMVTAKVNGKDLDFPARLTAVVEKRDGSWLIDQCHLSVPMAEQTAGHSFPG